MTEPAAQIPVLSLSRPWPTLLFFHGKPVENRTWTTNYRGLMLIHAAQSWDPGGLWTAEAMGLEIPDQPDGHPTGIIGHVYVHEVCATTRLGFGLRTRPRPPCVCGPWSAPGQFHWLMADRIALPKPVPCRGWARLWHAPEPVMAAVRAQSDVLR